jgi:hypothetical protein
MNQLPQMKVRPAFAIIFAAGALFWLFLARLACAQGMFIGVDHVGIVRVDVEFRNVWQVDYEHAKSILDQAKRAHLHDETPVDYSYHESQGLTMIAVLTFAGVCAILVLLLLYPAYARLMSEIMARQLEEKEPK